MARELISEHHLSPYASGELSPHAKLARLGGKVLCLGVGPEYNTMFHCGEDILRDDFPVRVYEAAPAEFRVIDPDGDVRIVEAFQRSVRWTYCCDVVRLFPYFTDLISTTRINGVEVYAVDADPFLERLLGLADEQIHMYGFHFPPPRTAASLP